jgi:hypothetical protein
MQVGRPSVDERQAITSRQSKILAVSLPRDKLHSILHVPDNHIIG